MKKLIITAATILMGFSVFSKGPVEKSNVEFQRYIAKQLSYYSTFVNEGVQGTVTVRVKLNENGFDTIQVLSGLNQNIDNEIVELIKKTPSKIVTSMYNEKNKIVIIPVTLIIKDN